MLRAIRAAFVITVALIPSIRAQSVSVKRGNIFFERKDGRSIQLTSSGLDSYPHLSADGQLVVFVRRTPSFKIDTGMGDVDDNELWIADPAGGQPPRRVLVGHPGTFRDDENLVLAGFVEPQFSPDKSRIYFVGAAWATSSAMWMLDLNSGHARYLCAGLGLEVLQSGKYAGFLIALKEIPLMLSARTFRYWVLDPDGRDVSEIGEAEDSVRYFKREMNDPNQSR